ncbi:sigma-70 family RNA polymerase sigma factor [Microbacterium betulae]|uniref:RNA polymerase sigma factor n=1 Tax=Microbacterium betulae TaxID=2981139 RepID=A0AA97FGY2_9MICO|nr:sigma-70 family RNA polymerase sigma factor [Microbacterium sp. AB]WOF21894.1 sigma-70 family RNA polymerase sigma factor [Microbacterium sp. AB]
MGGEHVRSLLDHADDGIVAGRAADGDQAAFAVLVRRYTPMMRACIRRMLRGTADVDDVVQEAFIAAWRGLPGLEDPAAVKSWLMRIVSRKAVDRIRAERPRADVDDAELPAPADASPPRVAEAHEELEALGDALRELPVAQRECWVLRELAGLTYDEVAEEMSVPVTTVRGLLARARKDVIARMADWR